VDIQVRIFITFYFTLHPTENQYSNNNYKNAANNDKNNNKVRGKILPTTSHKGTEGNTDIDYFYTSFISAAREGAVWSTTRPSRFNPESIPDTNFTGGWVGSGDRLDKYKESRRHQASNPGLYRP
jgi:hypothetical protein